MHHYICEMLDITDEKKLLANSGTLDAFLMCKYVPV